MKKNVMRSMLALALTFSAFPVGVVLGHGYDCYTALGYSITCGPKGHTDNDLYGNWIYFFDQTVRIAQWNSGQFDWQSIILGDGAEGPGGPNNEGEYGDTYIWEYPSGHRLLFTDFYWCRAIYQIQYSELAVGATNYSTQGWWDQWAHVSHCFDPIRSEHVIWVHAY